MDLAYCRVSTTAQDPTRQIDAMRAAGITENHIYLDKQTGAPGSSGSTISPSACNWRTTRPSSTWRRMKATTRSSAMTTRPPPHRQRGHKNASTLILLAGGTLAQDLLARTAALSTLYGRQLPT
jgi:hypothetical protein